MSEVKALFPIGKTQWRKWPAEKRTAFNEARAAGVPFLEAVDYVNALELVEAKIAPEESEKPEKDLFDFIEDAVEAVSDVVEVATPVIAVAKTVKRARRATKWKAK